MTLKELLEKRAKAVEALAAIQKAATDENRAMTADEADKADDLLAEAESLATQIGEAEAAQTRADRIAAAQAATNAPRPRASMSTPTTPPAVTNGIDLGDTAVTSGVHNRADDDPRAGYRDYDDFCAMVHQSSASGVLASTWANRPEVAAAQGQNTFSGEEGGFLIPPEFANRLVERAFSGAPARAAFFSRVDRIAIRGNTITINGITDHDKSSTTYRYGGVVPYWVDEAAQITRSNLVFRKVELKLHKLAALSFSTDEELSDAAINLGQRLTMKHGDAIGDELFEQVLFGTGAGKPLGVFHGNNNAVINTAKETAQTADTITTDNILDMEANLNSDSEASAIWLANREGRKSVRLLTVDIGTGGTLTRLFERGRAGGEADMLDGTSIFWTDHMAALGDRADIGLVDPSKYVVATKGTSPTSMTSIHLRFDYMETAFRTAWRVDGRPIFDRQLRPRKGATAKRESPYVTLAERA